jgi:hypothetical protein
MPKLLLALAAALLVAATTAGCGSGQGHQLSASEQRVADAMSRYLTTHGNGTVSRKDARCIAEGWVRRTGVAKLKQSKVLTSSGTVNTQSRTRITPALAGDYADALLDCVDYAGLQARAIARQDPKIDAGKMTACFRSAMPKAAERQLLVSTMTGKADQQVTTRNARAVQTCQAKARK